MRNFILTILVLVIAGGFAWKHYQPEVRELLGFPAIPPDVEKAEDPTATDPENEDQPGPSESAASPDKKAAPKEDPTQEAEIQRIVALRFPEVELMPFSKRFENLEEIPRSAYPDRITVNTPIEFKLTDKDNIVAVSYLKSGGMARPSKIAADGSLVIESLADSSMEAQVAFEKTDFMETLEANHDQAYSRAAQRVKKMREEESSDLREFKGLLDEWKGADVLWEEPTTNYFKSIQLEIERRLNSNTHRIVGFWQDMNRIDRETHVITTALIEGTDHGFGPFHWRVQCQTKRRELVKISGFPSDSK